MIDEGGNSDIISAVEPAVVSNEPKVDVPPDGGYGWVCVACCFLINAHTWGINSCYGSYLRTDICQHHVLDYRLFNMNYF